MRRTTLTLALLLLALGALPACAGAASPWWQLTSGARPTNLQPAPDQAEAQRLTTSSYESEEGHEVLVARLEVGGQTVGCLGSGELVIEPFPTLTADQLCEAEVGFPASETPAALAALLEGEAIYGGEVQVFGPEDIGAGSFEVLTPGRWVPNPVELTPIPYSPPIGELEFTLGAASSKITSEGSGRLLITATNLGDAPVQGGSTPLQITDRLPSGVAAYGAEAFAGIAGSAGPVRCTVQKTDLVGCAFEETLLPYEAIEVEILVALAPGAGAEAGRVSISGGEGPAEGIAQPIAAGSQPVPFGFEGFAAKAEEEGGGLSARAGAHPFQWTNTVRFNSGPMIGSSRAFEDTVFEQPALPRDTAVTLPAGLIASTKALEPCPMARFYAQNSELRNECPPASVVGVASVTIYEEVLGLVRLPVPIFSLTPARGEPARFGFMPVGVPVVIDSSVDPEDSYRITGEVRNAPQAAQVFAASLTLWGVPGDARHDSARGWDCLPFTPGERSLAGCTAPQTRRAVPFLRMPVSCAEALQYRALAEPWNAPPGVGSERAATSPPLGGCDKVPFDPEVSAAPTSRLAANPAGLDIGIQMPGAGLDNPRDGAISEGQFKRAEVAFPEGVTINPSIAEGLAVCSEDQYRAERYDSGPGEGCPQASKIGSVAISTPLLAEQAQGAVYQATPYENETESMIGLYLVAKIPERGILVKQPIEVRPDPRSGRLVSVAENVPQLPFDSFEFHFREGGRSPLVTPPGCGTFHTTARFVPWSAQDPDNPAPAEVVERQATFTVDRGVTGGACPQGPAPFHPGFEAGTLNNQAGSYSPFVMHLSRGDGEQDMGKFSFVLPPGVVGKLAGIPYCPEAAIARAQSRQGAHGGQEEIDDPSCSAASQIGTTVGGAGAGNQLTYVKGKLYLAGPWHGDPLSVVAITPAVAGPFDAGTVVVREALRLNPVTARAEVDGERSDPIPHILKGIPLNLRDLRVYADRPDFTLNATSCEPFKAESTIWGDGTALEPLGQTPVELSSRYQAAGCASLGFKPKLHLRLKGGTSRGSFPALRAAYVPRKHNQANLSRLALTFPNSEFIEQGHFRTICTRVQFAAGPGFGANCPKGSIYGHVKVWSPLLEEPLQGPVYLRSSNHNLPDAVLALHGLVDIEVATRIDSVHGRLRATVGNVPDAPVSRAIVRMQGGQKGLFVNSRSLCHKAKRNRARANAKGQNSRRSLLKPRMRAAGCKQARRKTKRARVSRARLAPSGIGGSR
jgi:hypothetical protein